MSDRVYFYLPALARLLELRQGPDPISPGAAVVGLALASFMNRAGECRPSADTLAERAGLSKREVFYSLKELKRAGFHEVKRRARSASIYRFIPSDKVQGLALHNSAQACTSPPDKVQGLAPQKPHEVQGIAHRTKEEQRKKKTPAENGGRVWALWIECNREAGRRDPVKAKADLGAGKNLAAMIQGGDFSEAELRECMAAYLADQDPWLVKQGHALRLLPGRLNAYLGGGGTPMTPEQVKASLRMREQEDRLHAEGKV